MVASRPSFVDYGLDIRDKLCGEHADVASLLLERRLAFPARAVCSYAAVTAVITITMVASKLSGRDWVTHGEGGIAAESSGDFGPFLNRATEMFLFLAFVMAGVQGCTLILSLPGLTEAQQSAEAVGATQTPTERLQSLLHTYEALAAKETRSAAIIVGVLCFHGAIAQLGLAVGWFPLFTDHGDTSNPIGNFGLGATDTAAWVLCISCTWSRVPTLLVVCTPLFIYASYTLITLISVWQTQALAAAGAGVVLVAITYGILLARGAVQQLRGTGRGGDSADLLPVIPRPFGRAVALLSDATRRCCCNSACIAPATAAETDTDEEEVGQPVPATSSFAAASSSSSNSTVTTASTVPVPTRGDSTSARSRLSCLCCCRPTAPKDEEEAVEATRTPATPIDPVQAMTSSAEADDALFADVARSHLAAARRLRLLGAAGMLSLTIFSVLHFLVFLASQFMDSFGVQIFLHAFITLGYLLKGIALPLLLVQFILLVRQRLASSLHNAGREAEARQRIQQQRGFLRYVCHEVRVPLNTISMGTDAIGDTLQGLQRTVQAKSEAAPTMAITADGGTDPDQTAVDEQAAVAEAQYLLRSVHTATRSLDTLVSDVLQMEKIELGKFDIEPERVGIKTLLEDLVASFEPDASRCGVRLHFVWAVPPDPIPVAFGSSWDNSRVARVRSRAQGPWLRAWSGTAGPRAPIQEQAHRVEGSTCSDGDCASTRRRGSATFDTMAPNQADVMVDPNRVRQVVANLVSNALKFAGGQVTVLAGFAPIPTSTRSGRAQVPTPAPAPAPAPELAPPTSTSSSVAPQLAAAAPASATPSGADSASRRSSAAPAAAPEKRAMCIAVCDNGIGLRKGDADQLFRAFAQIRPGASQSGKGTGLGLAICHAICGLHGGTISAWSPGEGAGSVFWLALPVLTFPSPPDPELGHEPGPGTEPEISPELTPQLAPAVAPAGESKGCPTRLPALDTGASAKGSRLRVDHIAAGAYSPASSTPRMRGVSGVSSDASPLPQAVNSSSPLARAPRGERVAGYGQANHLLNSLDSLAAQEHGAQSPVQGPPSRLSTRATMQGEVSDSSPHGSGAGVAGAEPEMEPSSGYVARDSSRVVTASSIQPFASPTPLCRGVAAGEVGGSRKAVQRLSLRPAPSAAKGAAAVAAPSPATAALPVSAAAAAVDPAPSSPQARDKPLRGARMLVVEDAKSSRMLLVRLLCRLGASKVDEAENGARAIELMQAKHEEGKATSTAFGGIHAVLTDSEMPVMGGHEAVQLMRRMGYKGTVVGVTGATSDDEIQAFHNAGADTVVPKPVRKEALLSALLPILPALSNEE